MSRGGRRAVVLPTPTVRAGTQCVVVLGSLGGAAVPRVGDVSGPHRADLGTGAGFPGRGSGLVAVPGSSAAPDDESTGGAEEDAVSVGSASRGAWVL